MKSDGPRVPIVIVVVAASVLLLAACSSGSSNGDASSTTSGSSTSTNPLAAAMGFTALAKYFPANALLCVADAFRSSLGVDRVAQLHLEVAAQRQALTAQDARKAAPVIAVCPAVRAALVSALVADPANTQQRATCLVAGISDTNLVALVEGLLTATAVDTRTIVAAASSSAAAACPAANTAPVTATAANASTLAKTLARRIKSCGEPLDESPSTSSILAVARCSTNLRVEVYASNNSRDQVLALRTTICNNAKSVPAAEVVLITDLMIVTGNEAVVREAATDLALAPVVVCAAK